MFSSKLEEKWLHLWIELRGLGSAVLGRAESNLRQSGSRAGSIVVENEWTVLKGQEKPHTGPGITEGQWLIMSGLALATLMASRRLRPLAWRQARLSQQTHPASYPHHTLPKTLPRHLLLSGSDRRLGSQGGS